MSNTLHKIVTIVLVAVMVFGVPGTAQAAFPAVETTNSGFIDTNTTSHAISMPASIAAGDTLVIMFGTRSSVTTTLSGWTEVLDNNHVHVYSKTAAGGDTATIDTSANSRSAHVVYRISGANGEASVEAATSVESSGLIPDPPSLTPSFAQGDTLWIAMAGFDNDGDSTTVSTIPTNYVNGVHQDANNGAISFHVGTARRELNAASEDPGPFLISASKVWYTTTVAVRESQSAGGSPSGSIMMMSQM